MHTPLMQRQSTGMAPQKPVDGAVRVALPGTCGELVQGTLDGEPCLISCPIGCYSIAEVRFQPWVGWTVAEYAPKTRAALPAGLAYLGRTESGGYVCLHTALPRGRGYGSSTADIGATLYALGQAAGRGLTPTEVGRLADGLAPDRFTDGLTHTMLSCLFVTSPLRALFSRPWARGPGAPRRGRPRR